MKCKKAVTIDITNVNACMCKTCIFHPSQDIVSESRYVEILGYLSAGTNHMCHTTDRICRGGRDFQLKVFCAFGFISEPTDEALYAANEKYLNYKNVTN